MGISINANSSEKMKTKGAHDLFHELLESYKMDEKYIQPFILQLKKTFRSMKEQTFEEEKEYEKKIGVLEQELNTLDERFGYGQLQDPILYDKLRIKKQTEINQVRENLHGTEIEISNLDYYLRNPLKYPKTYRNTGV